MKHQRHVKPFNNILAARTVYSITTVITVPYGGDPFASYRYNPTKRDVEYPTPTEGGFTITHELLKRTPDPTPTYVSKCTEFASALSSGCSCLLGTNALVSHFFSYPLAIPQDHQTFTSSDEDSVLTDPQTTTDYTSTSTLPLPTQCSSANGYGLVIDGQLTFDYPNSLSFPSDAAGCCAYCFASPDCASFYETVPPNTCGINLHSLGNPFLPFVVAPVCPGGTTELFFVPGPDPNHPVQYGVGPCGVTTPI